MPKTRKFQMFAMYTEFLAYSPKLTPAFL